MDYVALDRINPNILVPDPGQRRVYIALLAFQLEEPPSLPFSVTSARRMLLIRSKSRETL